MAGQALTDVRFRQKYGATVVGIRRDRDRITSPAPSGRLAPGDCLIVVGKTAVVDILKRPGSF
jgi:K+/H+ antiporter YhaU regulatory subunit KhtT